MAEAITTLEQALVLARVSDIPMLTPIVAAPLGWAYALAGRHDEGVGLLQDAVARAEAMELGANHAQRLVWSAEALHRAGRADTARRTAGQALERARRAAESLGWQVAEVRPPQNEGGEGRLEAREVSGLFRFVDDVAVRVRPAEGGSRVDVRSKSRVGQGDVGANAKRIRAFKAALGS